MAERVREAAGGDPPPGAARAFVAYLSSLVHDVSLLQGVLEHLGEPWCERADDGAWWDDGRAVSLSAALPAAGAHTSCTTTCPASTTTPSASRCTAATACSSSRSPPRTCCTSRRASSRTARTAPSDGAARPPRLVRGGVPGGAAGVRRRLRGRRSRGDARRGRAHRHRAPARRLRPRACPRVRDVCCALTRRNRRWSCRGHASAAARSRA